MRGIVLAGGTGSRLGKVTQLVNKHCLPVYNRLMIEWAIKVLMDNGITDITIVSSPAGLKQIKWVLGLEYTYCEQEAPGGIVQALMCAERKGDKQPVAVILGDNLFLPSPVIPKEPLGAHIFTYRMSNQRQLSELGVAEFNKDGQVIGVVEKPIVPPSRYAVTGLYAFEASVFRVLDRVRPSRRGELEIDSVLNGYAASSLTHTETVGYWGDAGTIDGLLMCSLEAKDASIWAMKY